MITARKPERVARAERAGLSAPRDEVCGPSGSSSSTGNSRASGSRGARGPLLSLILSFSRRRTLPFAELSGTPMSARGVPWSSRIYYIPIPYMSVASSMYEVNRDFRKLACARFSSIEMGFWNLLRRGFNDWCYLFCWKWRRKARFHGHLARRFGDELWRSYTMGNSEHKTNSMSELTDNNYYYRASKLKVNFHKTVLKCCKF